jgi:hypothetical protein
MPQLCAGVRWTIIILPNTLKIRPNTLNLYKNRDMIYKNIIGSGFLFPKMPEEKLKPSQKYFSGLTRLFCSLPG